MPKYYNKTNKNETRHIEYIVENYTPAKEQPFHADFSITYNDRDHRDLIKYSLLYLITDEQTLNAYIEYAHSLNSTPHIKIKPYNPKSV